MLAAKAAYHDLPPAKPESLRLKKEGSEISTAAVDLKATLHFLAVGSPQYGRSTVLRTLCDAIADTFTPEQAQVVLFDRDYRPPDAADPAYLKVYAHTISEVSTASAAITQRVNERRLPAGTVPTALAKWRHPGPHWFIIVDDLNVVTPPGTHQSTLFPLVATIESGHQLTVHILASHLNNCWFATGLVNRVIRATSNVGAGGLVMERQVRQDPSRTSTLPRGWPATRSWCIARASNWRRSLCRRKNGGT